MSRLKKRHVYVNGMQIPFYVDFLITRSELWSQKTAGLKSILTFTEDRWQVLVLF